MNRKLALAAVVFATLWIGLAVVASHAGAVTYRCGAEDDATWAWSRCGNHSRGVIDLRSGRKVVVGRCGFARLWMNGNAGGPSLRGDRFAVAHPGCAVVPTDINRN